MNLKGLRVITNLHCNNNCTFCYQKDKSKKILDLNEMMFQISHHTDFYRYKNFEYCTIMGGESTLLPNLHEYIKIGSLYAKQTRLTTNGKLLGVDKIQQWVECGLNGVNVSISTINEEEYKSIHGTNCAISRTTLKAVSVYTDVRINIPLCTENCINDLKSLKDTLEFFVVDQGYNVTMCEDIKGTYSLYNQFEKIGAEVMEVTDYGLIFLNYKGNKIGYYTHRNNNYNETDLVVTPLGTYINWDGYCEAVGMNV